MTSTARACVDGGVAPCRQAAAEAEAEREAEARQQAAEVPPRSAGEDTIAASPSKAQLPPHRSLRSGAVDLKALLVDARTAGVPAAVLWTASEAPAAPQAGGSGGGSLAASGEGLSGAGGNSTPADGSAAADAEAEQVLQAVVARLQEGGGGDGNGGAQGDRVLLAHFVSTASKANA